MKHHCPVSLDICYVDMVVNRVAECYLLGQRIACLEVIIMLILIFDLIRIIQGGVCTTVYDHVFMIH